jgi:GR25 family glycosyltransferase involved in LPS biosynthesis
LIFNEKLHQIYENETDRHEKLQLVNMDYLGFYINLDRSSQRKEEIKTQLEQLQLLSQYSRFPAADGNVLNLERSSIRSGEIWCFTSHYLLLEKNSNQTHHLHIIEDDVILSRATKPTLQMLLNSNVLDNFDIIFTDTCIPFDLLDIREYKTLFDSSVEKDESGRTIAIKKIQFIDLKESYIASTSSFLVHKNAIAKLHNILQQEMKIGLHKPLDFFIRDKIREGLIRAACIFPFITSIRLDHLVTTTVSERSEHDLSLLALSLLRHSFFIECDWAKCNQLIVNHFIPNKQDIHQSLLAYLFNFFLSGRFKWV